VLGASICMLLSKNECQNPRFTPGSLLSLAPSIVSSRLLKSSKQPTAVTPFERER
jgi:hypothetical protein